MRSGFATLQRVDSTTYDVALRLHLRGALGFVAGIVLDRQRASRSEAYTAMSPY